MRPHCRIRTTSFAWVAALAIGALAQGSALANNGNGHGNGNGGGNGHAQGSPASSLGALNGAHASDQGLAHASANSRVGRIAAYKRAVLAYEAAAQALAALKAQKPPATTAEIAAAQAKVDAALKAVSTALARAANKPVTTAVVNALDSLLKLDVPQQVAIEIAAAASALQGH